MSFLIRTVYSCIALFPGLAARTHRPCGRMGLRLQTVMGLVAVVSMACGVLAGGAGVRGWVRGDFGYFPAILLGLVAVYLLFGGVQALVRAARNPAPPLAANVVAFRRPAEFGAPDLHRYRRRER